MYLQLYLKEDIVTCNKLGLEVNLDKTGVLIGAGVFCEEYFTIDEELDWTDKQLDIYSLLNCYYAYNIVHAKQLMRPLYYNYMEVDNDRCIDEFVKLIRYWGYEFYKEEIFATSEMGGWRDMPYMGHHTGMLENYIELYDNEVITKAIIAESSKADFKKVRKFSPSKMGLHQLNDLKIDEEVRILCPHIDILAWNTKYLSDQIWEGLSLKHIPVMFWKKLRQERQITYRKTKPGPVSIVSVFNLMCKSNLSRTYLLPTFLVKEWKVGGFCEESDVMTFDPHEVYRQLDPNRIYYLEDKFHQSKNGGESLTDHELYELTVSAGLVDGFTEMVMTSFDDTCEELKNYDMNILLRNAAYLNGYNRIPETLIDGIEFPQRLPDDITIRLREIIEVRSYLHPQDQPMEVLVGLEKLIERHDLDRIKTYKFIRMIETMAEDLEYEFRIFPEKEDLKSAFTIYSLDFPAKEEDLKLDYSHLLDKIKQEETKTCVTEDLQALVDNSMFDIPEEEDVNTGWNEPGDYEEDEYLDSVINADDYLFEDDLRYCESVITPSEGDDDPT